MDISLATPKPIIELPKVTFIGVKVLVSATALYAFCASAPGIYRNHPMIRELERQVALEQLAVDRMLARFQDGNRAVLAKADNMADPTARIAFLREELQRASLESDGYAKRVKEIQALVHESNTWFRRLIGDKTLVCDRQALRENQRLNAIAAYHVDRLADALRECDRH